MMTKDEAALYVLSQLERVIPYYATDTSVFPDREKAREAFLTLGMDQAIKTLDELKEREERRRKTEEWFKHYR